MSGTSFDRRLLKARARETVRAFAAPCLLASAAVLAFTLIAIFIRGRAGGLVFPGIMDPAQFAVNTGLWKVSPDLMGKLGLGEFAAQGGLMAALRVDGVGAVLVYVLPLMQLLPCFLSSALVFLISTPIVYGALAQLWNVIRGVPATPRGLFHWYLDLRLTGKALAAQLVLSLWEWLAQLLCMAPSVLLMLLLARADGNSPLWYLVLALMAAGMLGGYYLALCLVPARLLLTRTPELSLRAAFSQGLALFRGKRKQFFQLSLSFLPWHLVSMFTYHVADLFLFPYQQLASLYFLMEAETPPEEAAAPELL